jgi:broad specificity phosphatase PhoE
MSFQDFGTDNVLPTVFLVRHGESTGNQHACLQGSRIGGALSELGRKQSVATASYLFDAFEELQHGNVRLVSSPSNRALETAGPIAERLTCEIEIDHDLSEVDFGDWSGVSVSQLERDPGYQAWKVDPWANSPPGGESLVRVRSRIWRAVSRLAASADIEHQPIVLVTHFFPLMALFTILVPGNSLRSDNASISRFQLIEAEWTPTHINDIRHLHDVAPMAVRYV